MIGKKQIEIGPSDFILGMTSGPEVTDGGISNETPGVNLTNVPGVAYAPAAMVDSDTDTRLTAGIIASSPDMNVSSPTNRLAVTSDGKAYRYNGAKLDAAGVALTAGVTYAFGFTDIITFAGEAYVSGKEKLTRWQNDNTIDAGASWPFSFTNSGFPHPGLEYENNMYWGDKNLLLIQSAIGDAVAPTTILTLAANTVIMALGIDPGTGLMLISTSTVLDVSGTIPDISKLLWYDGNSAKVVKSVVVDDTILGFRQVGSVVYVGYGNKIGYINGAGIQFLRKLKNASMSVDDLPYKHHLSSIVNTLYVADGKQVLAYGEVLPGRRVFYYAHSNTVNTNKYTCIFDGGSGKLGLAFATTKFYTVDTTSVATIDSAQLYTRKYYFDRPVFLRSVYIEYQDALAAGDNNRALLYKTETIPGGGFSALQVKGGTQIKNESSSSVFFIDNILGFVPNKARSIQIQHTCSTVNYGIKRIIIYYDPAE